MLSPLGLSPSFGFGDRLGLATRGHIEALRPLTFDLSSPSNPSAKTHAQGELHSK